MDALWIFLKGRALYVSVAHDAFSFDIFSQAARAVQRSPHRVRSAVARGLFSMDSGLSGSAQPIAERSHYTNLDNTTRNLIC